MKVTLILCLTAVFIVFFVTESMTARLTAGLIILGITLIVSSVILDDGTELRNQICRLYFTTSEYSLRQKTAGGMLILGVLAFVAGILLVIFVFNPTPAYVNVMAQRIYGG